MADERLPSRFSLRSQGFVSTDMKVREWVQFLGVTRLQATLKTTVLKINYDI